MYVFYTIPDDYVYILIDIDVIIAKLCHNLTRLLFSVIGDYVNRCREDCWRYKFAVTPCVEGIEPIVLSFPLSVQPHIATNLQESGHLAG